MPSRTGVAFRRLAALGFDLTVFFLEHHDRSVLPLRMPVSPGSAIFTLRSIWRMMPTDTLVAISSTLEAVNLLDFVDEVFSRS